jgi:hypothetical protein
MPHGFSAVPIQAVIWIVGLIFAAGVAWSALKQTKKDVNGVGARQRKFEKNCLLALLVISEKREDRELLAQFLKE